MTVDLSPIFEKIAELDRQAAHTDTARKQDGITYTPPAIVREMIKLLAPHWEESIHEPSCGRGMFAFALVEHWLGLGKTHEEIAEWADDKLFLCDTDEQAVQEMRILWEEYFAQQGVVAGVDNFVVADGLFGGYCDRHFDTVVGNPPYVRIQHLSEAVREKVRHKFPSCKKGNVDLYYAFLEDALTRANRACYIMPNSWFSNQSAKALRKKALPRLEALVDFGSELIFAPVRAYTAIVVFGQPDKKDPIKVRGSLPSSTEAWQDIPRDDTRWNNTGWTPLLNRTGHEGQVLGNLCEIVSGIATLSDKSFLLPSPTLVEENGKWFVEQTDPAFPDHTLRVPLALAPRLIKATKPGDTGEKGPRILCPYSANWKIIDEGTLQLQAPDLLAWLQRRRATLDGRDKGKTSAYEAWYAYGRRQGFWTPQDDEVVLLVPQMGNGKLTSVQVDLTKTGGRFLFTSGYVLRPNDPSELVYLEKQLGSTTAWEFVKREGKGWAGTGDYRTIGARALRKLPLH